MHKNIGYHTRLHLQNTVKVCGGSFGGSLDAETANRLVNAHFTVDITPSGRPVFVDRDGKKVSLYISVDPESTEAGQLALKTYRAAKHAQAEADEEKAQQLRDVLGSMTVEDALAALAKVQ